ncbi:alpha-(1,3)-fucosyltransferase C isoform X2 [Calliopsis andreniformis]
MRGDLRIGNKTMKILFWNTMFGDKTFYLGKGDIFYKCPVNDCYATHDKSYTDLLDFDAVLFHGNELNLWDLPTKRSPQQWYVFVNLESPVNRPLADQFYENFFNLTMTYRLDSDIVWTYGVIRDLNTDEVVAPLPNTVWTSFNNRTDRAEDVWDKSLWDTIRGKKKPVLWFVSNCYARSGRGSYVKELSKYIEVDIYGKCGNYQCPQSKDCFRSVVEPQYFFYLSFENSFCEDYVTEKLYNPLSYNVVPIVYGGANYSIFAPPGSYIDALDYDTPEELAKYLNWLMDHPRMYKKYFEWKKYYRIDKSTQRAACNLCEFLHEKREPQIYEKLSDWYSKSKCPLQRFLYHVPFLMGSALKNED